VNPFAQQAAAEDPKPEVKPAPKKLGQMNWIKDDDADAKPAESKPEPKKITNPFQADFEAKQRAATIQVTSTAPKKLGQMNWIKDDDADAKPAESKPEPKKITNTFQADVQADFEAKQRSATIKVTAPKKDEGDDFKNTLAAMLARGAGRPSVAVKAAPVVEEPKEKIALNVFDEDSGDEFFNKIKEMSDRRE